MAKVLGAASVLFSGVDDGVDKAAGSALGSLKSFGVAGATAIAGVTTAALAAGAAITAIGVGVVSRAVGIAAAYEQTSVAFEVLIGSAEGAQKLLGQLTNFAATTPFQMPGIEASARQLLAFGFGADDVVPILRNLGDIAAGTGADLTDLTQIYGRLRLSGRASMEDINRLGDKGIPILSALAAQLGVSASEVRAMVSAGKIGFPEVSQALAGMTTNGGMFEDMMARQSTTILGLTSTLQDNLGITLRGVGQEFIEAFSVDDVLSRAINWVGAASGSVVSLSGEVFRFIAGPAAALTGWLDSTQGVMDTAFSIAGATVGQIGNIAARAGFEVAATVTGVGDRVVWLFKDVMGGWLTWIGTNWVNIFQNLAGATGAIFSNMWSNMTTFFKGVASWLSGDGFDWKWTGLLEGFESTLAELPKIAEFQQSGTTAALKAQADALGIQIGSAYASALRGGGDGEEAPDGAAGGESPIADVLAGLNGTVAQGMSAMGAGTASMRTGLTEAFNKLQDAALGGSEASRTASATETTAQGVSRMVDINERQLDALQGIASNASTTVAVFTE